MLTETKISPAFRPFLAGSGSEEKQEAIVVYRSEMSQSPPLVEQLDELADRLSLVRAAAKTQGPIQKDVFSEYQKTASARLSKNQPLRTEAIGEKHALPVATVEITRKTLEALAEQANVVAVMPNQRVHLIRPTAVDYNDLGKQEHKDKVTWGLKHLKIPAMWSTAKTKGKGVRVAVLDTGVHGDHAALQKRVSQFVVVDPLGRRIEAKPSFDTEEHGTHVCGTIAGGKTAQGVSIGVAPEAELLVGAVLMGGSGSLRAVIEGISWAVENGAHVISMSLGFSYYEPLFATIFESLLNLYGIVPVVAVGNSNHGNSDSPGNAYNALTVGAVEKASSGFKGVDVAEYSSGCSLIFPGGAPPQPRNVDKPDVVAPGSQVYSCIPPTKSSSGTFQFTYMDGTSMATPHVAGAVALLRAAKPKAPVRAIIQALKDTADHPAGNQPAQPPARPDNRWGFGMIRPLNALKLL